MIKIIHNESRMITVTDDWYPCYENNQIELSIKLIHYDKTEYWNKNYTVKISAWGMDDHGVEIERQHTDIQSAKKTYSEMLSFYKNIPNGINLHWFCTHGFKPA